MIAFCILVKHIYFTLSLKKVRSWLESKTPIELDKNLKQYKVLRVFFIILIKLKLQFILFITKINFIIRE